MTTLYVSLADRGYGIVVGRGILSRIGELFRLDRRVFIVTDSGVPEQYAREVAAHAAAAKIVTVSEGESSKSIEVYERLLREMSDFELARGDCAVAVGGGVVGDLTGFAAATYMRGIDFYNVPTTLLSQVDSSIGGKTAVNLCGIKNIVGAFHQPSGVLIDTELLKTLPKRQMSNGIAEAIKMALTFDKNLFELFERSENPFGEELEDIILSSLKIKKAVVEADEREAGLRRVLNFGHTLGHGIEAEEELNGLYHGECVSLGMIPMCSEDVRKRLVPVLKKVGLPTEYSGSIERALEFMLHDKKRTAKGIFAVFCDEVGTHRIERVSAEQLSEIAKKVY